MSRTKKPITPEEQLKKVDADIKTAKDLLKNLKKAKKDLEEEIIIDQLKILYKKIVAKGMSIEQVMEIIDNIDNK